MGFNGHIILSRQYIRLPMILFTEEEDKNTHRLKNITHQLEGTKIIKIIIHNYCYKYQGLTNRVEEAVDITIRGPQNHDIIKNFTVK